MKLELTTDVIGVASHALFGLIGSPLQGDTPNLIRHTAAASTSSGGSGCLASTPRSQTP